MAQFTRRSCQWHRRLHVAGATPGLLTPSVHAMLAWYYAITKYGELHRHLCHRTVVAPLLLINSQKFQVLFLTQWLSEPPRLGSP